MNITQQQSKRGFTLIELLVVIAILAILAVAVVLILNPAELLKQGRDTTRISDLAAVNSAIALYVADVRSPVWSAVSANCTGATPFTVAGASSTCTVVSSTVVTGSGWVPVQFNTISSGAPLSRLPLDPVNSANYEYLFAASSTTGYFELAANMESIKYSTNGTADVESNTKDGGSGTNSNNVYQVGSELDLISAF